MGESQKIAENFYSHNFSDVNKSLGSLQSSGPSVTMRIGQNNACSNYFLDGQENVTQVISNLRKLLAESLSALGAAGVLNQSSGSLLDTPPEFLAESLIKTVDLGAASTLSLIHI